MDITAYNGTTVNGTTGVQVRFGYGNWQPYTAETELRKRVGTVPQYLSVNYGARQQDFTVTMTAAYSGTVDDFLVDVMALFAPSGDSQTLTARRVASDSSTEVTVKARVISFGRIEDKQWQGTFEIDDPYWLSSTENTDTSSPTTNAGSLTVAPKIEITNGLSATRNRATITDRTGHGIANYPVRIAYTTALDEANIVVYVAGLKAPFWYDSTSGALWVRVNCNPLKSTYVDIYFSTDLSNTETANKLDLAGLDADGATNTLPAWDDWAISSHPQAAALAWVPVNIPDQFAALEASDWPWTYTLSAQDANSVTFEVRAQAQPLANDWNGLLLTLPVPLASGATLAVDMTYTTWVLSISSAQNITRNLLGRKREDAPWELIASDRPTSAMSSTSTTYDWDLAATDVGGYVQLAFVFGTQFAIIGDNQPKAVFEIAGLTLTGGLDSSQTPSVSLSDDVAAMIIDGDLLNSTTGDKITFDSLLMDDVTLTLDPNGGSISPTSGPWYADGLEFTDSALWFTLKAGSNTWSFSGTGDVELLWHERQAF